MLTIEEMKEVINGDGIAFMVDTLNIERALYYPIKVSHVLVVSERKPSMYRFDYLIEGMRIDDEPILGYSWEKEFVVFKTKAEAINFLFETVSAYIQKKIYGLNDIIAHCNKYTEKGLKSMCPIWGPVKVCSNG